MIFFNAYLSSSLYKRLNMESVKELVLFLILLNLFSVAFCFMKISSEDHIEYEEIVNVHLKSEKRVRRSAENIIVYGTYHLEFAIEGTAVYVNLEQNTNIEISIPALTLKGGILSINEMESAENSTFYQDINTGAVFMIQKSRTGGESMIGVLRVKNRDFVIQSDDDLSKQNVAAKFKIFKQRIWDVDFTDLSIADITDPRNVPVKRRWKRATGEYQLELLIVVDYSIFKYWYDKSTATTDKEKEKEALETIKQFYAFVINGIDIRYKNIQTQAYTISVLFAGIIIAQTPSDSTWTETIRNENVSTAQVDSKHALENFRTWIQHMGTAIPGNDHAMLFTRYDLTHESSGSNAGLAYVGTVCTPSSQSIVEDHFGFIMITVAAHELGHSLSAKHDGDGNLCAFSDYYIMSASTSPLSDAGTVVNQWKFSSCSTSYFTSYIDSVTPNCMKELHSGYNATALLQYKNDQPGQVYDADSQCKHTLGTSSYLCKGLYKGHFSTICTALYCAIPEAPGYCRRILAAEGTLCGNQMWCQLGECKFDLRAPTGNENCLYGDIEGQVYSNQPWNCSDVASIAPHNCLQVATACCDSCAPYLPTVTIATELQTSYQTSVVAQSLTSEAESTTDQTSTTIIGLTNSTLSTLELPFTPSSELTESSASENIHTPELTTIMSSKLTDSLTPESVFTTEQTSTVSELAELPTSDIAFITDQISITTSELTDLSTSKTAFTRDQRSATTSELTDSESRSTTAPTTANLSEPMGPSTSETVFTTENTSSTSSQLTETSTSEIISTTEQMSITTSGQMEQETSEAITTTKLAPTSTSRMTSSSPALSTEVYLSTKSLKLTEPKSTRTTDGTSLTTNFSTIDTTDKLTTPHTEPLSQTISSLFSITKLTTIDSTLNTNNFNSGVCRVFGKEILVLFGIVLTKVLLF